MEKKCEMIVQILAAGKPNKFDTGQPNSILGPLMKYQSNWSIPIINLLFHFFQVCNQLCTNIVLISSLLCGSSFAQETGKLLLINYLLMII